jgi:hypothetical protein
MKERSMQLQIAFFGTGGGDNADLRDLSRRLQWHAGIPYLTPQ